MIMVLIIYTFFHILEKYFRKKDEPLIITEEDTETLDVETLSKLEKFVFKLLAKLDKYYEKIKRIFKAIKIGFVVILIAALYCGITSYAIMYSDRIKLSSSIAPAGIIYKHSDIKCVEVGVEEGYSNSYSPYYKVTFKDNKFVNLFGDSMYENNGMSFENILIDLDSKLRVEGIKKTVDEENFEKYSKGLDKDFISRVRKLFDYK